MKIQSAKSEINLAAATAQNQVRATAALSGEQVGIVHRASKMMAPLPTGNSGIKRRLDPAKSGVYTAGNNRTAFAAAADGYVRKTPVQEIITDPNYKRTLVKRALAIIAGLTLIVIIIYVLFRFIAFF